jgi:hypothetical protein
MARATIAETTIQQHAVASTINTVPMAEPPHAGQIIQPMPKGYGRQSRTWSRETFKPLNGSKNVFILLSARRGMPGPGARTVDVS